MTINGTKWKIFTFTMCYCVSQPRGVRFLPGIHQYRFFQSVELRYLAFTGICSTVEPLTSRAGEFQGTSARFHVKALNSDV